MSLQERQKEIVLLFTRYESWEEKYRLLIEIGKQLPVYPEEFRNEDHRVKGCQSQVWLHADLKDGMVNLRVDSDALIVKGLAALLVKLYSQATPEQILATSPEFISILDLGSHLSPSRANGLFAMVKQIKYYAAAFQVLQNQAR